MKKAIFLLLVISIIPIHADLANGIRELSEGYIRSIGISICMLGLIGGSIAWAMGHHLGSKFVLGSLISTALISAGTSIIESISRVFQ